MKKNDEVIQEEIKEEKEVTEEKVQDDNEQEVDEVAQDKESESERYIRLMADFQNYKNRVEKQKSEIYAFANEKIVMSLLEVLDNFDRALSMESDESSLKSGMEMILTQLKNVLTQNGLEEIEAENQPFDPNKHNGVLVEQRDGVEEGMVLEVLQKGYTLNGKVVRASMVKVSS